MFNHRKSLTFQSTASLAPVQGAAEINHFVDPSRDMFHSKFKKKTIPRTNGSYTNHSIKIGLTTDKQYLKVYKNKQDSVHYKTTIKRLKE